MLGSTDYAGNEVNLVSGIRSTDNAGNEVLSVYPYIGISRTPSETDGRHTKISQSKAGCNSYITYNKEKCKVNVAKLNIKFIEKKIQISNLSHIVCNRAPSFFVCFFFHAQLNL